MFHVFTMVSMWDLKLNEEEFGYVRKKGKLKVNVSKRKVMRICGNSGGITLNARVDGRMMEELKKKRKKKIRFIGADISNDRRLSKS